MNGENKKFIVYKSSAGSGKTFTLVREYLKIVIQNPEQFRQVLAITFTNKAANEMKERVIRNLMQLANSVQNKESDAIKFLMPQLIEQTGLSEAMISSRAASVLTLIMHNYAEFSISTIDSFTHRVIRTFAHDLKIPMNFDVELDADNMLSQSVDLLISQVGSDEKLTRILVDFVEKKAGDELSWQIEKDLNEFGKTLLSESGITAINELRSLDLDDFMKVRDNLYGWKQSWEKAVKKLAASAVDLIDHQGLTYDAFIQKNKSILIYLKGLAKGRFDKIIPNSYAKKSLETGAWINPKALPAEHAAFETVSARVLKIGSDLHQMISKELSRYLLCKILLRYLFSTALLGEIEKTLHTFCLENNKLLINEFNRRISEIVQEQPAPFIYERLGEKYHHYLIDEFQDTSILQWHNLLPLIENSLASNRMNMIVGDAKQAIYRWRSGDAEQFELLPGLIRKKDDPLLEIRERALITNYQEEKLDRNHRSSPLIVSFNNRLFESVAQILPENHGSAFHHSSQEAARKDKPGLVRIEQVCDLEDDNSNYIDLVHQKVVSIISELQEDNFPLRDLAILCRDNKKASGIAAFLVQQGIPVISSESLLLTQSQQVNFLVAWMQHLDNPADGIPMVHILHYLSEQELIPDKCIEELFIPGNPMQPGNFNALIVKHFPSADYYHLKNHELFGLVRFIIMQFGMDSLSDSYLRFFQDTVLEFVKDRRGGLSEFLEWWDDKSRKASVIIPEGVDAVRIMTVHKAKGLQFPAVIFPFADEKVRPTRKYFWVDVNEDIAEPLKTAYLPAQKSLNETVYQAEYVDEMNRSLVDMVNVLYVALTRPEERLYVITSGFPENADGAPSVNKLFSRFFRDEGSLEKGKNIYQYGERWKKSKAVEEKINTDAIPGLLLSGAELRLLLRRHAPQAWDMAEPEKNREWGNLVHLAMSMIQKSDQVLPVLGDLLIDGTISMQQYNDLSLLISSIMKHPEIERFFNPSCEVRNEPEIISEEGALYRPDRVLFTNHGVTIIEYKTGRHMTEHRDQVNEYASLIKKMNYTIESAYLIYLNKQPEVIKVI
jgi:ATP-dependent exoDNAse (exonuclease V) beta subunit